MRARRRDGALFVVYPPFSAALHQTSRCTNCTRSLFRAFWKHKNRKWTPQKLYAADLYAAEGFQPARLYPQRRSLCISASRNGHNQAPTIGQDVAMADDNTNAAVDCGPEDGAPGLVNGTFRELFGSQVPDWVLERLGNLGFISPTTVQFRSLLSTLPKNGSEPGSLGRDVVVHAQTGSGKTLAYLIPALSAVDPTRACVQALIIVPTQELGMQVYKSLRRITVAWPHRSSSAPNLNRSEDRTKLNFSEPVDKSDHDETDEYSDFEDSSSLLVSEYEVECADRAFPVLPMLNQADLRRQKLQLRKTAPRIIVGNPHRIAKLVESGRLRLDLLRVLVVDEFDACLLDTSTTSALQTVLAVRGRERRQTILVSATVPQHRHFLRQCVRQRWTTPDIEHIWIEEQSGELTPSNIRHAYAVCNGRKKLSALRALLQQVGTERGTGKLPERSIVFVMPSRNIEIIVTALNSALADSQSEKAGCGAVVGLWNEMSVVDRRRSMRRFRDGRARVLVATDVAARGLDIPDVSHVFHFDLPQDADAYLHRAGRAGRLGRDGMSVALVTSGEEFVVHRTENVLGIEFERVGGNDTVK